MKTSRILTISVALAAALFLTPSLQALATSHKPTLAQIESAKKIELEKKKVAEIAAKKLNSARGNLKKLAVLANAAQLKYVAAQKELSAATAELNTATAAHTAALEGVSETHDEIGSLARNAYMSGGGMSNIESVLNADGPQEIIDRLSALNNLGARNKTVLSDLLPRSTAVTELSAFPVVTSRPRPSSAATIFA